MSVKTVKRTLFSLVILLGLGSLELLAQGTDSRPGRRPHVIAPARVSTSAPLSQLAALAGAEPEAQPVREINPLGMPAIPAPAGPGSFVDPAVSDPFGLVPAPAPFLSFEGVNNRNSVVPPDTNGDVGKDHYVQWVNLSLQIFDKTTGATVLGPVNGNTLWAGFGGLCQTANSGDPVVLYDQLADRWIFSQFALGADGHQCLAISTTGDPTGPYHRYDYIVTPGGINDYPKFGIWPNAYLYMVNEFSPSFINTLMGGFDRQKMLVGDPTALLVFFRVPAGAVGPGTHFAPEPANLEGMTAPPAGRPGLFIQPMDAATWSTPVDQYNIWKVALNFVTPASSTLTLTQLSAGVPAFASNTCFSSCVPQAGTNRRLDGLSQFTMYRPVYRNFGTHETLLVNHTVGATGGSTGIRWAEIRNPFGSPVVHQTATHSPDNRFRWMGSAAMDGDGNVLLGYSISSSTTNPAIAYAGRKATDPLNTLPLTESVLIAGTGSQTGSSRWGDYSTMSVDEVGDPALGIPPDCGFWFTSEYLQVTGSAPWRTRVGAFQIPGCGAQVPPTVKLAVNGQSPPSRVVTTASPVRVTLDMTKGDETSALDWYYAIVVGSNVFWVTSGGISTTAAPLVTAPPADFTGANIFSSGLARGTVISFVFFLLDGADVAAVDFITAVVS